MENVHEGLKRFKCEKCSQKFTERKALTLHIKGIHEKIKEFNCDRCGKFFILFYSILTTNQLFLSKFHYS